MQILSELKEYAQSNDVPIIHDETVAFLQGFIDKKKITSVLEIGTAIGYSALQMAKCKTVKRVVSIERNYGLAQIATANIKRAGQSEIIEVINEDALKYATSEKFDLLFIDAAKAQYQKFLDCYIDNVKYVIADNMDFHGMVADPSLTQNRNTRALVRKLAKFKEDIMENPDYSSQYFTDGDGILLITKL